MNRILLLFCFFAFGAFDAQAQEIRELKEKSVEGRERDTTRNFIGSTKSSTNKNIKNNDAKISDYKIVKTATNVPFPVFAQEMPFRGFL